MLEKVLYVANFETYEPAFLRCLARLQEVGCRDLVLVHLPKTDELLRHIPGLLREGLRRCLDEVIQQQFDGYMQLCQEHGIAARCIVKEGELAWLEVRQLTQQEDIALVALGPLVGAHLGTTGQFLISGTRVPMLIVKVPEPVAQASYDMLCQRLFERVLYPTDWSPCARRAQDYIAHLKPLGLREVIVAHVLDVKELESFTPQQREAHRAQAQQQLAQTQRALEAADLRVQTRLLEGQPGRELVGLAAREDVTLLVMGTTGRGMAAEMVLGSVSSYVARTTEHSILLVCG